jgi:hypothetical protein
MAGNDGGPQPGGIREVARLAGVSVASASFALNGLPGVAERTRQRILAAAEQLGYRANAQAQALRRGRTTTYGFVVRNFANPFFLDVLSGAEEVAEEAGATVLILDSRYSLERESRHVREIAAQRLAGLAIAPVGTGESIRLWQDLRAGAPVVALNATADNITGVSRVGPDNEAAVALPMHRLAELGHSSVAFVSAPRHLMADPDRLRHFRRLSRALSRSRSPMCKRLPGRCSLARPRRPPSSPIPTTRHTRSTRPRVSFPSRSGPRSRSSVTTICPRPICWTRRWRPSGWTVRRWAGRPCGGCWNRYRPGTTLPRSSWSSGRHCSLRPRPGIPGEAGTQRPGDHPASTR